MQASRYDDLDTITTWAPRLATALCGMPAGLALYSHVTTGCADWLVTGVFLSALTLGVARGHRGSLHFAAILLMSVGVTMPVGAASPLEMVDVHAEPWIASSVAAGICSWLATAVLLIVLGWQLTQIRPAAQPARIPVRPATQRKSRAK